ncbi:hypothetical protein [Pseudomonas putida]|uniref:Uncharacterized protein n=1 Tax=Pseudomonas putida TaxID=303 RepID=A0A1Q9R8W1_PSEPU|nr:hypothetical protein [Pseudomonas putida]OLS63742.1 hypothetical protein PSEMO_13090 [Pseudomonas putida]
MTASNIQQFDEITGQVLGLLYEKFPVPHSLMIREIAPNGLAMDDFLCAEVPNEVGKFFLASVEWLAGAGYLNVGDVAYNAGFLDVVLTAKGLEVLKATPASLQTGPSFGEKLADASKGGAKEILRGVVSEVLSLGARLGSAQLGLPS